MSAAPTLTTQPSLSMGADFRNELEAAVNKAGDGFSAYTTDMGDREAAEEEAKARAKVMPIPFLLPQPSADVSINQNQIDDAKETALKESYPDKNRLSYAMKNHYAEMHKINLEMEQAMDPFVMMGDMSYAIMQKPDDENKRKDLSVLNTIVALFNAARENPDLRNFVADLFGAQKTYYDNKLRRAEINEELTILHKLYNEKELEDAVQAVKDRQAAREAAGTVQAKGKAKAENDIKKAADAKKQKKGHGQ